MAIARRVTLAANSDVFHYVFPAVRILAGIAIFRLVSRLSRLRAAYIEECRHDQRQNASGHTRECDC